MRLAIQMSDAERRGEPDSKSFAAAFGMHAGLAAILIFGGRLLNPVDSWGEKHASSGAVGVAMVKSIPIPQRQAPPNPLANESKSVVPQAPPEKPQPKPQAKAEPVKAVEIPDKVKKTKAQKPQETTMFRAPTEYKSNQVTSKTAPALSNPMYGMQGAGGIDIGPASVLRSRFGAYVSLMRDRISQHWNTADVRAAAQQKVAISFTIARNGGVTNVQISKPSGNYLLDNSAKRAVVDANPLPPLPSQFERNEATVELWFQLKQ